MIFYVVSMVLLVGVHGHDGAYEFTLYKDVIEFVHECRPRSLTLCLKEKALNFIEALPNNLDIGGGIKIKQNKEIERISRQYSSVIPSDETKEDVIDRILFEAIADYLTSHTLELSLPSEVMRELRVSAEEGRKKKGGKKGGGLMTLMMLFYLKAATLGAIALKVIGLAAFKALLVAKVALTISGIIALKKLLESKHHTSTYEVVAHPHYEEYGHHDRALNADLPYKSHKTSF